MSTTIVATHNVTHENVGAHKPIRKKAMSAPKALNEAYKYQRPSSFSRGMRLDIKGITILMIIDR